ncbi:hypothetical protein COLO4_36843 [Corchorus olitorius]|uniref:Pentatricopeptide repeat-containing protein n=1 Tax=Corchorus olitorius TaxID=93759 RepID=A0A1R3G4W4_9ROSI|nr:hypothetical protein COLO4_36843 [Corchorus olitorius]
MVVRSFLKLIACCFLQKQKTGLCTSELDHCFQDATVLYQSQFKYYTPAASPTPRGNSPINHHYISQILSRDDWLLLLKYELKAKRIVLSPQFIVSVLQNQENPLYPLRFYLWASCQNPLIGKNRLIKGVLASALYRNRPVLLSVELVKDIRNSGHKISFLGLSPSTRLYNAVIDALIKSNSLDLAYLKFQQMSADNCK